MYFSLQSAQFFLSGEMFLSSPREVTGTDVSFLPGQNPVKLHREGETFHECKRFLIRDCLFEIEFDRDRSVIRTEKIIHLYIIGNIQNCFRNIRQLGFKRPT